MALSLNLIEELRKARRERDMWEKLYEHMRKKLEVFLMYDVRKIIIVQKDKVEPDREIDEDEIIEILERFKNKQSHD